MAELEPVHLLRWIEANRHAFAPPVANKEVFPESEFIYQIVRGPSRLLTKTWTGRFQSA